MQIIGTAKAFNKAKNRVCLQPSSVYLMNHTLVLILSLLWTKHQFNTRIAFFFCKIYDFFRTKNAIATPIQFIVLIRSEVWWKTFDG